MRTEAEEMGLLGDIFAEAFEPRERRGLEDWLDAGNLVLASESGKGGTFDLQARPYQRGPVRAWDLPRFLGHCHCWAAQLGKTALGVAVLCWMACQAPTTMVIGYPDRSTAARRSRNMLIPTIRNSEQVAAHLPGTRDDLVTFEYTFRKAKAMLMWAGSSSSMSAETARIGWGDEVAKWRQRDKNEGDPLALFWRRLTDWGDLARKLITTTPNFEHTHGWLEYAGGTQHRLYVPCPHCGDPKKLEHVGNPEVEKSVSELAEDIRAAGYQVLEWRCGPEGLHGITGFGEERDPDKVAELARYRCVHCGEYFGDGEKMRILEHGKWIGHFPKRVWFSTQLPSWYSPAVKFGDVARRFFVAMRDKSASALQDWKNSDCAEPFVEMGSNREEKSVAAKRRDYARGTMPFRPVAIIITVDVQEGELYYEVGCHGTERRYAEIAHGKLPRRKIEREGDEKTSLDVLDAVRKRKWACLEDGQEYAATATFVDCGYDEEEVFRFCRARENCFALKGQENQLVPLRFYYPDQRPTADGRVVKDTSKLMVTSFSANNFRDGWALRFDTNVDDPGAWWLSAGDDYEYDHQICGQYKKPETSRHGRTKYVWKKRWDDHYFDVSVYQHVASVVLDVENQTLEASGDAGEVQESGDFVKPWATDF
jgi:phage terminase large subunit GpA-like protein